MNSKQYCMAALATSGLAVLAPMTVAHRPQAGLAVDLSFTIYSEAMEPVSGARVRLDNGGQVLATNGNGHTPAIPTTVGSSYDVHLKERVQPYGTLLGQSIVGYAVPEATLDLSTCATRFWETILTQPTLRPLIVSSEVHEISSSADQLWRIDINEADHDTFNFPALIGSLSTADSIYGYLRYCSIAPLDPGYVYGLAIRTTEVETFGTHGAMLSLDCSIHAMAEEPVVDVYFIASSPAHFGATTLSIDDPIWNSGGLRFGLSGNVGIGTTVLLVRPAGDGPNNLYEVVAHPPTFQQIVSQQTPNPPIVAQRCTPPDPGAATVSECTPPEPPASDPSGFCPQAATKVGPAEVTSDIRRFGAKVCGNSGPPTEVGETIDWGASLSAKFNIKGITITAGGNYKRTDSVKTTVTPGAGAGCGECKQAYKIRAFCKQKWLKEVPSFMLFYPHTFQSCKDKEETTGSVTEIIQETMCQMGC